MLKTTTAVIFPITFCFMGISASNMFSPLDNSLDISKESLDREILSTINSARSDMLVLKGFATNKVMRSCVASG